MKKAFSLILAFALCLCLAACSDSSESNDYADKAVDALKEEWTKIYRESKLEIDDWYLEIKNTRVITIKDNDDEHFKNIEAIVKFDLLANYYNQKPAHFYSNPYFNDNVIFYKDGKAEVYSRNYFEMLRLRSYNNDFSGVIDRIEDLGTAYNAVYHLEQ